VCGLGRGRKSKERDFSAATYPKRRMNLATVFVEDKGCFAAKKSTTETIKQGL
jgi:hypothetical protein